MAPALAGIELDEDWVSLENAPAPLFGEAVWAEAAPASRPRAAVAERRVGLIIDILMRRGGYWNG